jgi:hypothetical protein
VLAPLSPTTHSQPCSYLDFVDTQSLIVSHLSSCSGVAGLPLGLAAMPISAAKRKRVLLVRGWLRAHLQLPRGATLTACEQVCMMTARRVEAAMGPSDQLLMDGGGQPAWCTGPWLQSVYDGHPAVPPLHLAVPEVLAPPPAAASAAEPPAEVVVEPPPATSSAIDLLPAGAMRLMVKHRWLRDNRARLRAGLISLGLPVVGWRTKGCKEFKTVAPSDESYKQFELEVLDSLHRPVQRLRGPDGSFMSVVVAAAPASTAASSSSSVAPSGPARKPWLPPRQFGQSLLAVLDKARKVGPPLQRAWLTRMIAAALNQTTFRRRVARRRLGLRGKQIKEGRKESCLAPRARGGKRKGFRKQSAESLTQVLGDVCTPTATWSRRHGTTVVALPGSRASVHHGLATPYSYRSFCRLLQGRAHPVRAAVRQQDVCEYCNQYDTGLRRTIELALRSWSDKLRECAPALLHDWTHYAMSREEWTDDAFLPAASPLYLLSFYEFVKTWHRDRPELPTAAMLGGLVGCIDKSLHGEEKLLQQLEGFSSHWQLRDSQSAAYHRDREAPTPGTIYFQIDFAATRRTKNINFVPWPRFPALDRCVGFVGTKLCCGLG